MKMKISRIIFFGVLGLSTLTSAASIEERIAELEAQQSLRTLQFSGFLQTFYDSIDTKQTVGKSIDAKVNYFRLKSSLNFNADFSERAKFYSRLTATKFFNATRNGTLFSPKPDLVEGRSYVSSAIYLEKAYADFTVYRSGSDSVIFTMGRLPTVDGPPAHLQNGQDRSGTYPIMAYDSIFDGFALSYNIGLSASNLSIRAVYTPFVTVNQGNGSTISPYTSAPTVAGNNINNFQDLSTLMIEWNKQNLSFASGFDLIFQPYVTGASDFDGTSIGGSGTYATQFSGASLTASLTGIAGLPFDFVLSGASSTLKNSGVVTAASFGGKVYGIKASTENEEVNGTMVLASARYGFGGNTFLGAEYLSASKGCFSPVFVKDDLTNFYSTNGDAYTIYGIYKPLNEFMVRLSYSEQNSKYSDFGPGPVTESDRKTKSLMATARLDF